MFRLAIVLFVMTAACDEGASPAPAALPAAETTAGQGEEAAAPSLDPDLDPESAPDDRPAPRMREHELTAADRLGVAPLAVGLAVGAAIPEGSVEDADGNAVSLAGLVEDGPVMLVFYRGGWCPYCNFQVHALTESYGSFESRGVTPVLVSVDRIEEASRSQATYEIPFPVLSDPDLVLHRAFSVVHEADDAEVERLTGLGIDIEASSGRNHHEFAIPSIFIIDGDGKILWRHVDPEYRVRPSAAQLLEVLDGLGMTTEP